MAVALVTIQTSKDELKEIHKLSCRLESKSATGINYEDANRLTELFTSYKQKHQKNLEDMSAAQAALEKATSDLSDCNSLNKSTPAVAPVVAAPAPNPAPEPVVIAAPVTEPVAVATPETVSVAAPAAIAEPVKTISTAVIISPSFDCSKASSTSERLICSNSELAAADNQLMQVYKESLIRSADKDALKKSQNMWRKTKKLSSRLRKQQKSGMLLMKD